MAKRENCNHDTRHKRAIGLTVYNITQVDIKWKKEPSMDVNKNLREPKRRKSKE